MRITFLVTLFLILSAPIAFPQVTENQPQVILSADQHSGYTSPAFAFEKSCQINAKGRLIGHYFSNFQNGNWGVTSFFASSISSEKLQKLQSLIALAKDGPFEKTHAFCDIGLFDVYATLDETLSYPVLHRPDCASGEINQNPAAKEILDFVESECAISLD